MGFYGLDPQFRPAPYLVGTYPLGGFRVHAGLDHDVSRSRAFMGFDRPLAWRWTLMGGYLTGREGSVSWGLAYQKSPAMGWLFGVEFPRGGAGPVVTTHIVFTGLA